VQGLQPSGANSVGLQQTTPSDEAHYLRATNVLSLTVTDAQGNTDSPQISFYRLSEGAYVVALPRSETFTATLVLKNSEAALLDVRTGTDATTTHTVRYQDLTLDGNRQAQIVIGPQGFAPLQRDANNDGTFDTAIPASVDVSGADANDNEPPVLTVTNTRQATTVRVTITATDPAGVQALWYSLDQITFKAYTGPLDIDPSVTPILYTFAEDKLANRSGLRSYNLIYRVYLPLLRR
jgi:hypothetical protein